MRELKKGFLNRTLPYHIQKSFTGRFDRNKIIDLTQLIEVSII